MTANGDAVVLAEVVQIEDVGVGDAGGGTRLLLEARSAVRGRG